ncbi:MAG: type II toxin-antitoxin system VapC family toxin [Thermoguttaceae bacterium]|jgi:predicted nucleic acid-binding protein
MIVIDSNVIGYLFVNSQRTDQAEAALAKDADWRSPPLWRSEFRNVLTLYMRKQLLALEESQKIMGKALQLMAGREYDVASSHVLQLAAGSTCSAYDCEFVALARDLGVPLVTVDKQIITQFPDTAIALDKFVAI